MAMIYLTFYPTLALARFGWGFAYPPPSAARYLKRYIALNTLIFHGIRPLRPVHRTAICLRQAKKMRAAPMVELPAV